MILRNTIFDCERVTNVVFCVKIEVYVRELISSSIETLHPL